MPTAEVDAGEPHLAGWRAVASEAPALFWELFAARSNRRRLLCIASDDPTDRSLQVRVADDMLAFLHRGGSWRWLVNLANRVAVDAVYDSALQLVPGRLVTSVSTVTRQDVYELADGSYMIVREDVGSERLTKAAMAVRIREEERRRAVVVAEPFSRAARPADPFSWVEELYADTDIPADADDRPPALV